MKKTIIIFTFIFMAIFSFIYLAKIKGQAYAQTRTPLPNCQVDLNHDGTVDRNDLSYLQAKFGQQVSGDQEDLNNDGLVNIRDFAIFRASLGLVCPSLTPTPTSLPLPSGVISYWPAESNANDLVGLNDGVLLDGVTFEQGQTGQAFGFDTNSYVETPTINLPTGNSDRTIVFWVKVNHFLADVPDPSSPFETFFTGYGNFGSFDQIYALGTSGNVLYFSQWGGALFGPSLVVDRWYHVAVTNVGNEIILYLDGAPVANGYLTLNTPSVSHFYLGRIPGVVGNTRKLDGLIDEVMIFNRALSPSEILSL